jgi:hypothetical protein
LLVHPAQGTEVRQLAEQLYRQHAPPNAARG